MRYIVGGILGLALAISLTVSAQVGVDGRHGVIAAPAGYDGSTTLTITDASTPAMTFVQGCGVNEPALAFDTDGDTGFCSPGDDVIDIRVGNLTHAVIDATHIIRGANISNDPGIRDGTCGENAACFRPRANFTTGMGGDSDTVTLLAGGTMGIRVDEPSANIIVVTVSSGASGNPNLRILPTSLSVGIAPAEPEVCSADTVARSIVWADDTDDSAAGAWCSCIASGDDGAGTTNAWDWRRFDDNGTACPFF